MRILVGNNSFSYPGGSETYNFSLIEELVRIGHEVIAVAHNGPGIVSKKLNEIGVDVCFKPIDGNFDLCLLSHSSSINLTKNVKGYKIQTCHGIFPKLEQPVPGMDDYVSISEEVQSHLKKLGYESNLIRNGINCERYNIKNSINEELKTVLSLAHSDSANEVIKRSCEIIGCELIICNKFKEWKWNVEDAINSSDLVISLGRGAYESMACGRNLVIFDQRSYMESSVGDGFVTLDNVNLYLKNNCSGRFSNREYDHLKLSDEILKYNRSTGKQLREFALTELNISIQAKKYIDLLR